MIRFLFDTDICVHLLRGRAPQLYRRLRRHKVDEVAISSITLAELQYGVAKSARPGRHEALLAQFLAPLAIAPFDAGAAEAYGKVRTALERQGVPIGPLDTLIAAHALALHCTLVTCNEREFRRVEGLAVENWLTH